MIEKVNLCEGCAECIGCGRKFAYGEAHFCDRCGEGIDDSGYDFDDEELCEFCACERLWEEKFEVDGKVALKMGDTAHSYADVGDVVGMCDYLNSECPPHITL